MVFLVSLRSTYDILCQIEYLRWKPENIIIYGCKLICILSADITDYIAVSLDKGE